MLQRNDGLGESPARQWLRERILFGMKSGLLGTQQLLERLGNPQRSFSVVLIGGTNGKGSVSSGLAHVLNRSGRSRVGLFTSPHLVGVEERLRCDGAWIRPQDFEKILCKIQAASVDMEPTFFEVLTVAACLWFAEKKVELGLFEVGLGGRLDCTNALEPQFSILTSIGLDHVEILGGTEVAILQEKMGILRPGHPVLSGIQQAPLQQSLLTWCEAHKNIISQAPPLDAEASNRWLVAKAFELLQGKPLEESYWEGFAWHGRFQKVNWRNAEVWVDGAHNEAGATALKTWILRQNQGPVRLLGAMVGDKDAAAWVRVLEPVVAEWIWTRGSSERFVSPASLAQRTPSAKTRVFEDLQEAYGYLFAGSGPRLISGSLYLVGETVALLCSEVNEWSAFRTIEPSDNERAPRKEMG